MIKMCIAMGWNVNRSKNLHFPASLLNRCMVMNIRCWSAGQYTWQSTGRAPMHSLTMGTREQWSIPRPHGSLPSGALC